MSDRSRTDQIKSSEPLLTPEEAAEILRVKLSWLYQHTRRRTQDRIPFVKIGRYLRFREQDLVAYIEGRRGKG
jgi:excisionase family DNA binding protein